MLHQTFVYNWNKIGININTLIVNINMLTAILRATTKNDLKNNRVKERKGDENGIGENIFNTKKIVME